MSARALSVRATTASLADVRRAVGAWAEAAGLPESAARRLVLAVDEAVSNAILHSLGGDARRRVRLSAEALPGGLTVSVVYGGSRFDPTEARVLAPEEALRQRATHGYGLTLIRRLADDVRVSHDGGRNAVRLTVRTRPAGG